ncbi:DUF6002 family protein [Micromonospora sp. NPDC047074]|uniref:DUF6002 family protein n=1 Tax=Micromonospora sp. NPDC047074 TaxID=3154339 RepID=UPI003408B635
MARPSGPVGNLITDYYGQIPDVVKRCVADPRPCDDPNAFSPGFALPTLDEGLRSFFAAATARWTPLGTYGGSRITLLDLTGNPGTQTTKTFASLLIVARAVEHIRRTGQPVLLFTPTSANKGTALRDAVLRAIDCGLVTPDQLRVTTLAPRSCLGKLRSNRLTTDAELRRLNPLLVHDSPRAEDVKALGRQFVAAHAEEYARRTGGRLWFSLELANYLVADAARAFFEHDADPVPGDRPRLHAHAVSSAFGLLGYHQGRAILEETGASEPARRPASLLVQHLHTPDMVLNLRHGDFDRAHLPSYEFDAGTGLHRQSDDPHFPLTTHDPGELLDPTFYTHQPVTSAAMNEIIRTHGGDGIVVSLHECVERYPLLRAYLADTGRPLPADLRRLREWSLVMALTGVFNAVDRGLVDAGRDIVVHGSGSYGVDDYRPAESADVTEVRTTADIAAAVGDC